MFWLDSMLRFLPSKFEFLVKLLFEFLFELSLEFLSIDSKSTSIILVAVLSPGGNSSSSVVDGSCMLVLLISPHLH